MNATAAREDPQDVLKPKVLPQRRIDDLCIAANKSQPAALTIVGRQYMQRGGLNYTPCQAC